MLTQKTKVADEVWIILALLHRENPKREDFTVTEIVERARQEKISGELRPGVPKCTPTFIVSLTVRRTRVVTGCSMPPAKTRVACFEKPMTSIRNAAEEK